MLKICRIPFAGQALVHTTSVTRLAGGMTTVAVWCLVFVEVIVRRGAALRWESYTFIH
jgi:hypothetical protein